MKQKFSPTITLGLYACIIPNIYLQFNKGSLQQKFFLTYFSIHHNFQWKKFIIHHNSQWKKVRQKVILK